VSVAVVDDLKLDPLARGETHRLWVHLAEDAIGRDIAAPVIVARGKRPGPVFGITAAVHGNELNGIPIIHRLMSEVDADALKGTIVAVPVVNIPGYTHEQREFPDGEDLNRIMPGRSDGNVSEHYAHNFIERIVKHFDILVDLHTASFGRANSLYIRADMSHERTARLARLISPQIIVHNPGGDGTLRGYAEDSNIPSLTVEVGDPHRFQRGLIRSSRLGIQAVLDELDMYDHDEDIEVEEAVECSHSYWIYTQEGGVLRVLPSVTDTVKKGDTIATITDLFGGRKATYHAPEDGIVIGKSTNPVAGSGARVLHLGIVGAVDSA
jgi:predicted deacylase